jgi:hypothetical protein
MLRRRVLLEQGSDEDGALAALQSFCTCADFDVDFLYLAALVRAHDALRIICASGHHGGSS